MDAKKLYWSAQELFLQRNRTILPQIQLQHGRIEKWFVPEFVAAMNSAIGEAEGPTDLRRAVADTEHKNIDITFWEGESELPAGMYEAKVIYSTQGSTEIEGVVATAADQLGPDRSKYPFDGVAREKRIGLFLLVFQGYCDSSNCDHREKIKSFTSVVRGNVKDRFKSDHDIRITKLTELTQIAYSGETWHTQSWITWGHLQ